jgi:hypothetical protein
MKDQALLYSYRLYMDIALNSSVFSLLLKMGEEDSFILGALACSFYFINFNSL